jgi:hypothetical protein
MLNRLIVAMQEKAWNIVTFLLRFDYAVQYYNEYFLG